MTPRSYYGRPVLKEPVWIPDVAGYFFSGGLAGASATLAAAARRCGNDALARRALLVALSAVTVSPLLLIRDLGRRERFVNMLRVFKVTSPMSVGTWVLTASGALTGVAAGCEVLGVLPRTRTVAEAGAGALGPVLSTYTAVLLADTAVPAWHEARFELPFVFAGSSAASAGAAALMITPCADAAAARRLCAVGSLIELGAAEIMLRHLGALAAPYREGEPGRFGRIAGVLTAGGALAVALRGGQVSRLGAAAVLTGTLCQRWRIFRAGFASARDPRHTVGPQRERLQRRLAAPG